MTARQAAALASYSRLLRQPVFRGCSPVLAGTFPLGLDVPTSDLDVICQANDPARFADRLSAGFAGYPGFRLRLASIGGLPTVVAGFRYRGFPVEVFAQVRPPGRQRAVRHLRVEERLLRLGGDELRECVHAFKLAGLKTEPAFARCLGLEGDPYLALLELERFTAAQIGDLLQRARPFVNHPAG